MAERATALTVTSCSALDDSCFTTSLPKVPVAPVTKIVSAIISLLYLVMYLCLVVAVWLVNIKTEKSLQIIL